MHLALPDRKAAMSEKPTSTENMFKSEWCFAYPEHTNYICSVAVMYSDGIRRSAYGGETLEEIRQQPGNSTVVLMRFEDYDKKREKRLAESYNEITEISAEDFDRFLNQLRPHDLQTGLGATSFICSEAMEADYHGFYTQIGNKFFAGYCTPQTSHQDRVARVAAALS